MQYWRSDETMFGDAIYAALLALIEQKSPTGRTLTVNDDKAKERVDGEVLQ